MLKLENKNFDYFYLSTNTSSTKVKHIIRNPKATVYFYDEKNFIGLELIGKIVIINDEIIKSKLWKEEFKIFYKEGKDDPDYCILKFIPEKGNYYENLKNYDFKLR
jgi:general stress protein 26